MSKALEAATQHFRNKIGGEMQKVEVPEWDLTVYFKPSATLREQSKVIELSQQGKTTEALVETLIQRARNEDGTKMFAPADKQVFMNEVDPEVMIRVAGEINGVSEDETMEEAEKN